MTVVGVLLLLLFAADTAWATDAGSIGNENLLWLLALILLSARLFAPLARRLGFPAVLAELLLGVVLGNLGLVGFHYFAAVATDPVITFMAQLGVIILLLQVGLETRLTDLLQVGGRALAVGSFGIIAPFVLTAFFVGPLLLPGLEAPAYWFLGATLSATSVGITSRVFRDLGKLGTPAARIVLGAAVIDDILGLVILAIVSSLAQSSTISIGAVTWIISKSALFFAGSIWLGRKIAPHSSRWLAQLDASSSMLFAQILATGLFLAWLGQIIGLAPVIGAFAAGLLFEPLFLRHFQVPVIIREVEQHLDEANAPLTERLVPVLREYAGRQHEHLIEPIGYFFVPVFFVLTGMQVDLHALADPTIVAIALGVSATAIVGKLAAGIFAGAAGRWIVGWGMVPRGEVGLIFAMTGKQLGVVSEAMFSVIVVMIILTSLLTPPMLTWFLRRQK
jgi:Kef-type K+ transport system membrane component KefB